ncbi:hypothetical protein L211DRAFT_139743 [Terfezia boudieri ATCC MYA-4762]|uniref:Uncharacterized protein n=1 Tax=Terfezia boudieri ATCC MYA-4762 TaxID=1051890 RepID=A0A3N4LUA5_9PEZI|nr:hypothetical protein L211DRAFT_139743 [Terfezia boudieri ATCC MYA-4762]
MYTCTLGARRYYSTCLVLLFLATSRLSDINRHAVHLGLLTTPGKDTELVGFLLENLGISPIFGGKKVLITHIGPSKRTMMSHPGARVDSG